MYVTILFSVQIHSIFDLNPQSIYLHSNLQSVNIHPIQIQKRNNKKYDKSKIRIDSITPRRSGHGVVTDRIDRMEDTVRRTARTKTIAAPWSTRG
jgi:hypothetical protein